ncbi:MAG: restriction endonuclease [Nitrosarchaeum sp.]|nr:restriction endonuclease [Nitrosarchaeum sp.]
MTLWLVRAGRYGEQEQGALNHNLVAIGWDELPSLSGIKEKEDLEELYSKTYPNEKKMQKVNRVGQIWSFLTKIKKGDLVALPLKTQSAIAIGEISGDYEYKEIAGNIKHIRGVKWLKTIPRSEFDQDILFSLGAFLTVGRVRRDDAEERVRKMLKGEKSVSISTIEKEVDELTFDLEQMAKDKLMKYLEAKFSGHSLASLIDELLKVQGYVTKISPPGPDGGVDILAGSGPLGFDNPKICIQVKSSKSPVDVKVLRELEGVAKSFRAEYGIMVAWGGLTKIADQEIGRSFFSTRLWDSGKVVEEILKHYEKFSDELKAELPLKRIWTIVEED